MKCERIGWTFLLACAFAAGGLPTACGGESGGSPTLAVRLEFLKGYHSWSPRERREAANLLTLPQYRNDPQVGAALFDMALNDRDPEIRLSSFVALCGWRDLDGRLAWNLARLFKLELEPANKPRMAQAMTQLKFKTDPLNALIAYTFSPGVDHPNFGGDRRYGWTGRSVGPDWWQSENFRILLDAINKLGGKRFVPANYTSRQVIDWWRLNAIDFQEDDRKLARQLRETGESAPVLASVAPDPERPADPRLAEMFERLEKEAAEARRTESAGKKGAGNAPMKEEDLE